jgi:hypothetical protein
MVQVPPPAMHLVFSLSATHENAWVMSVPLSSSGELVGGVHVATLSMSMSLSIKNLGNVPPRLETLGLLACFERYKVHLRCQ